MNVCRDLGSGIACSWFREGIVGALWGCCGLLNPEANGLLDPVGIGFIGDGDAL